MNAPLPPDRFAPPPLDPGPRVRQLAAEVAAARPGLCAERALLITEYFRDLAAPAEAIVVAKARALAHVLARQSLRIHEGELLVGNFTAQRVGGALYPELVGLTVFEDLLRIERRAVNPMRIVPSHRRRLFTEVLPYWATRNLVWRSLGWRGTWRWLREQSAQRLYVINESGGIAHFVPDYATLLRLGTTGLRAAALGQAATLSAGDPRADFYRALVIACDGLDAWAARYHAEALRLAEQAPPARAAELREIAARCARVPREPATTLAEGLQSIVFAQIALNLESLDNGISPGRLDQLLDPLLQADLAAGRLDRAGALELLGLFAVKLSELVPVLSARVTRFHGGLMSGQAVVIGGSDAEGRDATNDSTWLWLDLMAALRLRQPNLHARFHAGTPPALARRVAEVLGAGSVNPAVYNDAAIVPNLVAQGVPLAAARDYAVVGCVEPSVAGASYLSTDAALVNVPAAFAAALGLDAASGAARRRVAAASCAEMESLYVRFERALGAQLDRLLPVLGAIERGNAQWHPTPLSSLLLRGPMETGRDASAGGARYNGSGLQCVGAVDVGDALAALEQVVFVERAASLAEVLAACAADFNGHEALRARLRRAPKYGNGDARVDAWVGRVMRSFAAALQGRRNARGGPYVAGFYSMTCHQAFGEVIVALPNGRQRGEPLSSGLSPQSGMERAGPTAALLSQAALPLACAVNGVNFNLKLAPWVVRGAAGAARLQALIGGAFAAGCMQTQFNVIDPALLLEARDHPGKYPGLLVRVSGYSAYFDDLSPQMKQEVIERAALECG